MATFSSTDLDSHYVYLDLSSRSPIADSAGDSMKKFQTNRIALKCDNVSISTSKNIMAFPTPAIGIATGESVSLGLDLGMSTKSVSLSGIITEQTIHKQFNAGDLPESEVDPTDSTNTYTDADGAHVSVNMTAQEIAQLIHSYVDSSFMQSQQNLNRLIILIPSRVGPKFLYHDEDAGENIITNVGTGLTSENCPLIPFTYAVRDKGGSELDASSSVPKSKFPKPIVTDTNTIQGLDGFVRSFDTTFVGGSPFIEFNLSFEIAFASM
tara:strand:+ start:2179 stop:2979 length:801 start_codon:yes stop_codon:yes gene_type:complete